MKNIESEYVEFTKICGDCGRRFKMKFEMPDFKLNIKKGQKELKKFTNFFFEKYNVCCNQCSKRKQLVEG